MVDAVRQHRTGQHPRAEPDVEKPRCQSVDSVEKFGVSPPLAGLAVGDGGGIGMMLSGIAAPFRSRSRSRPQSC